MRAHRAGEGAPYIGLKPAGRDLGPAIPAAERAIATGSEEALVQLLTGEVQEGLSRRFKALSDKKKFAAEDVSAGREYVESYVTFIHYVENLHEASERPVEGHYKESN